MILDNVSSYEIVNNTGARFTAPLWWVSMKMPCKNWGHVIIEDLYTHNPDSETDHVLITRYRGGLGDQICMLPAIEGKLDQVGDKLEVAVPELYFCLYQHLPLKQPLIDTMIEENSGGYWRFREHFREVYDCYCPAGRYEHLVRYDVQKSRVENFCDFCRVPFRVPKLPQNRTAVPNAFAGLKRPVIGFELKAANWQKDWPAPRIAELSERFKKHGWTLVSFDHQLFFESVPSMGKLTLEELGSVLSQLDFMISVDSGLLHYTLALGVPTLGLFGPTTGYHTTKIYDRAFYLQNSRKDVCTRPCYYSPKYRKNYCQEGVERAGKKRGGVWKGVYSTCMSEISVDEVEATTKELLGRL